MRTVIVPATLFAMGALAACSSSSSGGDVTPGADLDAADAAVTDVPSGGDSAVDVQPADAQPGDTQPSDVPPADAQAGVDWATCKADLCDEVAPVCPAVKDTCDAWCDAQVSTSEQLRCFDGAGKPPSVDCTKLAACFQ